MISRSFTQTKLEPCSTGGPTGWWGLPHHPHTAAKQRDRERERERERRAERERDRWVGGGQKVRMERARRSSGGPQDKFRDLCCARFMSFSTRMRVRGSYQISVTRTIHQVEVEGLHSSKTYDINFSPVGTLPHTLTIMVGDFRRDVPWGEIPGLGV